MFFDSLFDTTLSKFIFVVSVFLILFSIYIAKLSAKTHLKFYCEALFSQSLCLEKGFVKMIKIGRVKRRQITLSTKRQNVDFSENEILYTIQKLLKMS